jgi:hypothetical protein
MRWSERRTALRHTPDDFDTSTARDARPRPPSLIFFSLGLLRAYPPPNSLGLRFLVSNELRGPRHLGALV